MLFVSISNLDIDLKSCEDADGIELRLDLLPSINTQAIEVFLKKSPKPLMLTLRRNNDRSEGEREALIKTLLSLKPPFFDLEYDMHPQFLEEMLVSYPETQFVISYHNFERVPDELDKIYHEMTKYEACTYKIAAKVHSTNEALKMVLFGKGHPQLSVICMGEKGSFARVLGPVIGNVIDYACLEKDEKTAPGQLTLSEIINTYNYRSLNRETAIYGLIGSPVSNSPGHVYHNRERLGNSVYVKMDLDEDELNAFIPLAQKMAIRGLSVTIPLKEKIVPFVDVARTDVGAFNTLSFKGDQIIGTNTDGVGALDAIEKKGLVRGKKMVILGAGGAGRSIAFEAKKRGAKLYILNRNVERAKELGQILDCEAGSLENIPLEYDVLINCSPNMDLKTLCKGALVMDVVYFPKETPILKLGAIMKCPTVYGEEMFINQAAAQRVFWKECL